MDSSTKKKLARATTAYWFLLFYIIAALVWWFISLAKQNSEMAEVKLQKLQLQKASTLYPLEYNNAIIQIENEKRRNSTKYISEGITFLALIFLGAVFVYRAVRRQLRTHQQQENFMMAVTHELKTPIAVAKLNLETLQKYQLDETTRQKLLLMTLQETNRLNALTKEELNLSDLVKSCIQDFRQRFPDRIWQTEIDQEIEMAGDPLLLTILTNNLLENAMKYSPKSKPVVCSLQKNKNNVLLKVIDSGTGITDEEKKKIFEKFYRIGNEATRTTRGTGLGLYLCKKIAADHNADIYVTDNSPSGCIFVVSFKH
jgi:signal transduction histidine kinase